MPYSPVAINTTQNALVDSFDSNFDNACADGIGIGIPVGQMSRSGSTVTVNAVGGHNFTVGQTVVLSPGETNFPAGTKTIVSVVGNTFTYTESGSAATSTVFEVFGSHSTQISKYNDDMTMSGDGSGNTTKANNNRDLTRSIFRTVIGTFLNVSVTNGWTTPGLNSPWGNVGGSYPNAQYFSNPFGEVKLRGRVSGGSTGSTIFTLPSTHVPSGGTQTFIVHTYNSGTSTYGWGVITINISGNVQFSYSSIAADQVSLDGINFKCF